MSGQDDTRSKRRASLRIDIETKVTLEHEGGVLEGTGGDFNDQSMLVLTEELLPVGTAVTLRCTDDTGKEVLVQGSVTRHQPATEAQPAGLVVTEGAWG